MPDRLEVYANLMRSSGLEPTFDERTRLRRSEPLDDRKARARNLSVDDHRHLRWIPMIATDRRIDHSLINFRVPPHECVVHPGDVAASERVDQRLIGT